MPSPWEGQGPTSHGQPVNPNALAYSSGSGNNSSSPDLSDYSNWNGDYMGYLTWMAENGDAAAQDKLFNYMMSEASADKARQWTADREDTAMQRFVKDFSAAGLNPYALLAAGSNSNPVTSSSSGNSYSGTQFTTQRHNKESEATTWLKTLVSIIPVVLAVAAAAL